MTAGQTSSLSADVSDFLQRHRAEAAFEKVRDLARECYPHFREMTFRLRDDPDVDDRYWCVIELTMPLIEDVHERVARSRRYHERLTSELELEFVPLFAVSQKYEDEKHDTQ